MASWAPVAESGTCSRLSKATAGEQMPEYIAHIFPMAAQAFSIKLSAANDQDAADQARLRGSPARAIEVWERTRLVARMQPKAGSDKAR